MSSNSALKEYEVSPIDLLISGPYHDLIEPYVFRGIMNHPSELSFVYLTSDGNITYITFKRFRDSRVAVSYKKCIRTPGTEFIDMKVIMSLLSNLAQSLNNVEIKFIDTELPTFLRYSNIVDTAYICEKGGNTSIASILLLNDYFHETVEAFEGALQEMYNIYTNIKAELKDASNKELLELKQENACLSKQVVDITNKVTSICNDLTGCL